MKLRSWFTVAIVVLAGALISACGSGDDSGDATSAQNAQESDPELVAQAKEVTELAGAELVYSPEEWPSQPDQVEAYGEWRGPESAPEPPQGTRVEVIACDARGAACVEAADGAIDAIEAMGWEAGPVIDGAGSPQGFTRAFNTALGRNPDAIVAIGLTTEAVGDSLTTARERGIVTVVTSDVKPESGVTYDAYVDYPYGLVASLAAWSEIAEADGNADQIVIIDNLFEALKAASLHYVETLSSCAGCSTTQVEWQVTDALDPTKVNAIITGALSNNPEANGVYLPYGSGLPSVTQAVAQAGRSDEVRISNQVADQVSLQSVAAGESDFTVGWNANWGGWAAVDQVNRGLNDEPYLESAPEVGMGIGVFTEQNAPSSGTLEDWDRMVDFAANYKRIWGVE